MAKKPEETENAILVSSDELGEWLGMTTRRILQLTKDGILEKATGQNGVTSRKYDLKDNVQGYIKYLRDKASGRATVDEAELKRKKLEADIALKESQGELHQLKTAIASGQYISVEEVQIDYEKFFTTFKTFAAGLPARVVGLVAGSLEPVEARRLEKELSEDISRCLTSFAVAGTEDKPAPKLAPKKRGRPRKNAG